MNWQKKTKAELLQELRILQQSVNELENPRYRPVRGEWDSRLVARTNLAGFVMTENNLIVDISSELARVIGYEVEELVGKSVLSLVAPESKQTALESVRQSFSGPYKAYVMHKDGGRVHVEAMARNIDINGHTQRVIAIRDISEQENLLQALMKSEQKFSIAFHTSPDSININRLSDGMYIEINQGFTDLTGYTPEDVEGRTSLELDIWNDPADRARLVKGLQERGEVTNLEAEFRLKDGQYRVGLMSAKIIELDDQTHILSVTRDISRRKEAEEKVETLNSELLAAYDATLEGWAQALHLRDPNTNRHSERMVVLTLQLAEAVGIPQEEFIHIRRGVLLHDIGKMGIPDSILLKPGPLMDDEWVTMRKHPTFACEMLSTIPFLEKATDIPCHHHEKWDGTGYPQGLSGEEIPIFARIFSIIDTYDALLSDRTYRLAWTHNDTIAYIREQAGMAFDPDIVGVFLNLR